MKRTQKLTNQSNGSAGNSTQRILNMKDGTVEDFQKTNRSRGQYEKGEFTIGNGMCQQTSTE